MLNSRFPTLSLSSTLFQLCLILYTFLYILVCLGTVCGKPRDMVNHSILDIPTVLYSTFDKPSICFVYILSTLNWQMPHIDFQNAF